MVNIVSCSNVVYTHQTATRNSIEGTYKTHNKFIQIEFSQDFILKICTSLVHTNRIFTRPYFLIFSFMCHHVPWACFIKSTRLAFSTKLNIKITLFLEQLYDHTWSKIYINWGNALKRSTVFDNFTAQYYRRTID